MNFRSGYLTGGLVLVAAIGLTQPALSQGAVGPGAPAVAPAPRATTAPPPAPQVLAPSAPAVPSTGIVTGAGPGGGPRSAVNPGTTDNQSPVPQDRTAPAPSGSAPVGGTPVAMPPRPIFDRWGNWKGDPKDAAPAAGVSLVSTSKANGSTRQVTTDAKGLFTVGRLTPGLHELVLSGKDLDAAANRIKIVEIKGDESPEDTRVALVIWSPTSGPGSPSTSGVAISFKMKRPPLNQLTVVRVNVPSQGGDITVDGGAGATVTKTAFTDMTSGDVHAAGLGRGETVGHVVFLRNKAFFEKEGILDR
jgi:hypothetical protein